MVASSKRFRPTLVPTLMVVPALVVLLGLGFWQLERQAWKTALIDRIEARIDGPAEPLPPTIDDLEAWDYRAVTVGGEFDHDREMALAGRVHNGRPGFHLITPLRRTDGDGPPVLVDRGWVPADRRAPDSRPDSRPSGPVTVTGVVRRPQGAGWMTPDNDASANTWYWIDIPGMAAFAGLDAVAPVIVEAGATPRGSLPVGGQTRVDLPNNHLEYALTWFGFAVILSVIYFLYHWRRGSPDADGAPISSS